jgi:hypothetical protein
MTMSHEDDSTLLAEFEATTDPLERHFEKVEQVIERWEREGVCSEEVARAVREEVESLSWKLFGLVYKTLSFHETISNADSVAALLTREQLLLRLNELGYPLTPAYFENNSGRSGDCSEPPVAEWWGRMSFYRLDEVFAWAKSQRLGAVRFH